MNTLLTREGDKEMFRKVYPFSPALVQTLVAVSSLLQRERTALKLMLQLLVDRRDTLELGDVVPVGDLFDVISEGDEPFTQAMRMRFDDAKKLYRQKLLPMLEDQHSVTVDDIQSGKISDDLLVQRFRNDDRLLKTLLLSSLADGVEVLRGLTPARLAALNHGTVRSPIPGQESQMVLSKCRHWAGTGWRDQGIRRWCQSRGIPPHRGRRYRRSARKRQGFGQLRKPHPKGQAHPLRLSADSHG